MSTISLNILLVRKALVILRPHTTDLVVLYTDLPSPLPKVQTAKLSVQFDAEGSTGVDYVREHFGIEPEVGSL